MGITSVAAGGWLTAVHENPVSMPQVGLQPSPPRVLPSSHASCGNLSPSPQNAVQVPPAQCGSMVQVGEQRSYGMRFPSSHCSKPSLMPSPQVVAWQTDLGGDPCVTQAKPGW